MADKLYQVFEEIVFFHYGWFLDLGDGFPTASYPFSQTRFSEAKVATRHSLKVTTYLFLVIFTQWLFVWHPYGDLYLLFVRESEDFIGFLCNS